MQIQINGQKLSLAPVWFFDFLPIIINQLHSVVGIAEAETTLDSHTKLTWEQKNKSTH